MVSFNHDVSSLTRKDPALKYNLRNRPSSRSAAPAGPAPRPHSPRGAGSGARGLRAEAVQGPCPTWESPWGLPALGSFAGTGPQRGGKATEGPPRSSGSPRRDTAVAPLASSCRPRQPRSFGGHQRSVPLTLPSLPHGGGPARGSCRVAAAGPRGCSRARLGRWMLGGPGRTSAAGRRELCSATARKGPDFPGMSIWAKLGKRPLCSGGREAKQILRDAAVGKGGTAGRSGPATLSLSSDQIFIRAGAAGHGKGFAWG